MLAVDPSLYFVTLFIEGLDVEDEEVQRLSTSENNNRTTTKNKNNSTTSTSTSFV